MNTMEKMVEAAAEALWDDTGCSWAEIIAGSDRIAANTRAEARAALSAAFVAAEGVEVAPGLLESLRNAEHDRVYYEPDGSAWTSLSIADVSAAKTGLIAQAARIAVLEAERDAALAELHKIADVVETHWKGAGLTLEAKWIIDEICALAERKDDAADERDAAIARAEKAEAERDHIRSMAVEERAGDVVEARNRFRFALAAARASKGGDNG